MSDDERLASLLSIARESLRGELQPTLEPALRYRAAMVGNALAIAARRLSLGDDCEARQLQALAALYPEAAGSGLRNLERRLARELRRGRLDVEREERVRAVLLARTLARLEISNPDYPSTMTTVQAP
ncbi:MAG TPA: DUF6285 domain-containing protein [Geminicoccaceae bacterium]|nr:DUF6285 domain-containing protein [Geminicoccus sp.]HMU50709.1 DUF6285 domain-containing protein [Geminicoccaceae bacterium]